MEQQNYDDFKVLKIKYDAKCRYDHHIFAKKYEIHTDDSKRPIDRTLFVQNLPPWIDSDELLQRVFSIAGTVSEVMFQGRLDLGEQRTGFRTAYVVYASAKSLHRILSSDDLEPCFGSDHPPRILRWMLDYNAKAVEESHLVDMIAKARANLSGEREQVGAKDDDGWTKVTRKGRNPGLARKESVEQHLKQKQARREKMETNFYRHQIREGKMRKLVELREEHQKACQKVADMKKARKFKPQ